MTRRVQLPVSVVLALVVSGCVQTTTGNLEKSAVAPGTPLVLNTAPAAGSPATAADPGAPAASVASAPPASPNAAPTPVVSAPAPAPAASATPVVASTPAPGAVPEPPPLPGSGPVGRLQTSNEFPNINVAPKEPGGTLLPPEERKRIISELEALRAGQGAAPPESAGPGALTTQAETHGPDALKQIEKCSQEGAADKYPECAPGVPAD